MPLPGRGSSARGSGLDSSVGILEGILLHARPLSSKFFLYLLRELKLIVSVIKTLSPMAHTYVILEVRTTVLWHINMWHWSIEALL